MPRILTRIVLFLSSYTPLFIIMFVKLYAEFPRAAIALLVVGMLSFFALLAFMRIVRRFAPDVVTVENFSAKDADAMSYIVSYLIPFLEVDLRDGAGVTSLVLLFGVVAILYVNSNMIYINPMLNLLGYHLFEVEIRGGRTVALITRRDFYERETSIRVVPVGNQFGVEVPDAR